MTHVKSQIDFDSAFVAHILWKARFRASITREQAMDVAAIESDRCCELGQWLYEDGQRQYGSRPEFTALIEKHKDFHQAAGQVAQLINSRNYAEATRHMELGSSFDAKSLQTGLAISALKVAVG